MQVEVLFELPAAVAGERGGGVDAVDDQLPQLFGAGHVAGVAAAHRDDGDGVVARRFSRDGGRRCVVDVEQLGGQVVGERDRRRVVEHQGGRQPQPGDRADRVAQLDRGQRVEPHVAEGAVDAYLVLPAQAEDGRGLLADEVQQQTSAFGLGEPVEPDAQRVRGGRARAPQRGPDQVAQQRRNARPRAQVHPDRQQHRFDACGAGVEQAQRLFGGDGREAGAAHPVQVGPAEMAGHRGPLLPHPPGQRDGGQPEAVPVRRESVQVGVGCRVVALPGPAQHPGHRREQHERRQVPVGGKLVQVPRRLGLGRQHRLDAGARQRLDGSVVQHAGGVHHRPQAGDAVHDLGQRGVFFFAPS